MSLSRISSKILTKAIHIIQSMDLNKKGLLIDDIHKTQPAMLASILVLPTLGVSMQKTEEALNFLLVCFLCMTLSERDWPQITEEIQEKQLQRFIAQICFTDGLNNSLLTHSVQQFIKQHPEKHLLAWVSMQTTQRLSADVMDESDKHIFLSTWNLVNCIAFC